MKADDSVRTEILAVLDRCNEAVAARNLGATLELFATDPDVQVYGSEQNELAMGPAEVRQFFAHIHERPVGFAWEWDQRQVSAAGDIAWFVADGNVILSEGPEKRRAAYRFSGVLERRQARWLLLLLHGAEPVSEY